jgi:flagellar hook-associated protein 2
LTAAHVNAHASLSGGALRVESLDHGSGTVLGITSSVGAGVDATGLGAAAGVERTGAGIDVVGTIDGQPATGVGQLLSAATGPAKGLTVRIGLGATGALGTVSYTGGVTGAVSTMLGASGIATVALADSISSIDASKVAYNAQIDRMQERITNTEARLRRQFTDLETSLAQLRSQGSRLSAILGTGSSSSG